jgi:DNA-binding SARP family transcriptional activator/tetratricopeptide (TPR) repeat protein
MANGTAGGSVFFGYLGSLLVKAGGASTMTPPPRQRTFLAVLLTRAGRPVTIDELAEFVWDGTPPDRAADTLRTYVMRLRRVLGDEAGARIVTRDPGYLINVTEDEVDALRFARACREGAAAHRAGQWAGARAALADGLSQWRGDPLADIPSQLLRDAEVPSLHRQRLQAVQWRIDADLRLGGGEELVAELEALTAQEPLREQLHALLMTALARAGRASEALAVYQRARDLMVSQLGIEPGPELRELHQRVLAGDQVGPHPAVRVSSRAAGPVPHQLPAPARHFTARATELKELDAVLDQAGTVTISSIGGMAGIGKTTLALHWAHKVADRFPDGQLYVNLHGFGPAAPMSPADALRGFLDALRDPRTPLPADADAQEALYRSLTAGRRLLIVLDNARDEQQVRPLLPGSARCLTLITSRNQLAGLVATNGAVPLSLDLLTETEARELLSRRLGPERLAGEPAAADQFAASCSGLPLALCIAAARAALAPGLPLATLAAQLSEPGLDALSGADPYADLRSVFSWSYQRLSADAARLFRCLPFFPGEDVTAPAAGSIVPAGRADGLLAELTGAHLLEEYGPGRFRLHDLLARYAQERAGQEGTDDAGREVARRVLTWYLSAAAAATRVLDPERRSIPEVGQPDPVPAQIATRPRALEWLEAERRNLVAAVDLAASLGFEEVTAKLSLTLWSLFAAKSLRHDWLRTSLAGVEAARRIQDVGSEAHLCASIGVAYWGVGRPESGISYLDRALAIWQSQGDLYWEANARSYLSSAYYALGRVPEAISESEQSAALARDSGNRRAECTALSNLGWYYQNMGDLAHALSCYLAAREIVTETPRSPTAVMVRANLAGLYLELDRFEESIATATAAIEFAEPGSMQVEQANAHRILGDALNGTGHPAQARTHWRAAQALYRELGDPQAEQMAARLA